MTLFNRAKSIQADADAAGLGSTNIFAKKLVSTIDPAESEEGTLAEALFSQQVTENEILTACRDLFFSGFYSQAIQESFKALDLFVQKKSGISNLSGTKLMRTVFAANDPKFTWSNRISQAEKDEHEGYQHLFAGAMLGIRNPTTHEFNWNDDAERSLEIILFAQHLIRRAKEAELSNSKL